LLLAVTVGLTLDLERGTAPAQAANPMPVAEVTVATIHKATLPIFASGLGTVQASQTVAIHAQVDGKLDSVQFVEGQHVEKGQPLAMIDPRLFKAALDQATAKKAQDQATLIAARKDLARFIDLARKNFESQQNVDQQQAKVDQGIAQIAADDANIESAQTQLDYTTIRAPASGRIGVRQVDPGNIVHAADQTPLTILTQTQPAAVMFTLPAQYLGSVREAMQRGPVEVLAYDRDNRHQLAKGTLLLIDNLIDQSTATIRLKAVFPNDNDVLWPGEFVNARILTDTRKDATAIPTSAIQRGPNGVFAWIVTADNKAVDRPLQLGPVSGDQTIVEKGVTDGERVVTDGFFKLQRNGPVTIKTQQDGAQQDEAHR
jgi:multidrug efflux system membrane fusion protein